MGPAAWPRTMVLTAVAWQVMGAAVAANIAIESLSWVFVYRTSSFKRMNAELERTGKKLTALKTAPSAGKGGAKNKKENRLEAGVATLSRYACTGVPCCRIARQLPICQPLVLP